MKLPVNTKAAVSKNSATFFHQKSKKDFFGTAVQENNFFGGVEHTDTQIEEPQEESETVEEDLAVTNKLVAAEDSFQTPASFLEKRRRESAITPPIPSEDIAATTSMDDDATTDTREMIGLGEGPVVSDETPVEETNIADENIQVSKDKPVIETPAAITEEEIPQQDDETIEEKTNESGAVKPAEEKEPDVSGEKDKAPAEEAAANKKTAAPDDEISDDAISKEPGQKEKEKGAEGEEELEAEKQTKEKEQGVGVDAAEPVVLGGCHGNNGGCKRSSFATGASC